MFNYIFKSLKKYLNHPLLWWTGLLMAFSMAQLWLARNNREALYFFLAAIAVTTLNFLFAYKSKTQRVSFYALIIFLIPAAIVAMYAAVTMPEEAAAEDYQEITLGLKHAKNGADNRFLILSIADALKDGKISKWESVSLRNEIFARNGFLLREDTKATQQEARKQLQTMIDRLKPVIIFPIGEINVDALIKQVKAQISEFEAIENCLRQVAFGKEPTVQSMRGSVFAAEITSFKIVQFDGKEGNASFSLNLKGTSMPPALKNISGNALFTMIKLEPGEHKQGCMPPDQPYKISLTKLKMSE